LRGSLENLEGTPVAKQKGKVSRPEATGKEALGGERGSLERKRMLLGAGKRMVREWLARGSGMTWEGEKPTPFRPGGQ